jgi:hypothetical protein
VLEVYARWVDGNVRYRRLDPAAPPGWQPLGVLVIRPRILIS